MPADEFPKSAFAPFNSGKVAFQNPRDVITNQPFAYFHTSQSETNPTACWYQPAGFVPPASEALGNCFGQMSPNSVVLDVAQDSNVANCVTIPSDATTPPALFEQDYVNCVNTLHCVLQSAAGLPSASSYAPMTPDLSDKMQAPAPVVPLIIPSQMARSDNLPPRKAYYHKRHHPSSKAASNFEVSASELKNKTRFSATGASGKSTVVRDCKMSISSSPPSPNAGSVGGSLCSSISRSHFKPIPSPCSMHLNMRNSATALSYSPTKISPSPTLSSASPRLSTSSSSGVSSRKRRADDESGQYRQSVYSSTSDVIAGVGHVHLCDRPSTGSVSPVDSAARAYDRVPQQPHKRSKNDNDEDDDVIFVSMEAGVSKPKTNLPFSSSQVMTPFKSMAPVQTVQSARKSKKNSSKSAGRNKSPVSLAIPSPGYAVQSMPQYSMILGSAQYASSSSAAVVSAVDAAQSKGYYLRSSVNFKKDFPDGEKAFPANAVLNSSNQTDGTRYFTRSHQKRYQEAPIEATQVLPNPVELESSMPKCSPVSQTPSIKAADKSVSVQVPNSYNPSDSTRMVILNDARQRHSSFSKLYEIKGKIGVGGGGVVFAGTRKADNVEVAIKRVPREKVKRWGKLDGISVPIEFELLHKAAASGNKGVIKMYDWFQRRNTYILVMERPQPVIDLFDYLNQHGAMSQPTARKIFRQVVKAVRHCHANNVIHRDIKDENVLLNLHTSEVKLIDFGCGTFGKEGPFQEFAGTPEFYPPEWFTDRSYEGRQVDAWSLGVLLYTMVEAEVPFQKEDDIVRCQLKHRRLQGSSGSLCRHLIASMLQKNKAKRLTLEEVLQHPWFSESADNMQSQSNRTPTTLNRAEKAIADVTSGCAPLSMHGGVDESFALQKTFPSVMMVKCKEEESKSSYRPTNYVASPMPQSVVLSNECIVHS